MFDLKLFLGFCIDDIFQHELKKTNPYLISLLIGKEEYLEQISSNGKCYLGKYLAAFPTVDQLEISEKHLLSLLLKLVPQYPFPNNPPVVITLNGN